MISGTVRRRAFYDKRIAAEIDGGLLGDEYKGYIFKIAGGNDKQGFPMKQGIMTDYRVKLLLTKGACFDCLALAAGLAVTHDT